MQVLLKASGGAAGEGGGLRHPLDRSVLRCVYLRYISATQVEEGDEPAIALYHKLGYTFVRREEGRRLVGDMLFGKSVKVSRLRYEKTLAET